MDITIRLEQPADYREAETVTREAFWNCYSPGCMEHYLLHVMRRSPRFVRELDFVAVADGKIVGSVVFMKAMIMGDDGNRHEVLTLGPIAVLPAFQRKGIGRMLIEHARTEACRQGYRAMLLCGDPLYYQRVGFTAAEDFGIRTSDNKYLAALQVCPLYDHALQGLAGRYFEDETYAVDEAEATALGRSYGIRPAVPAQRACRGYAYATAFQGAVCHAKRLHQSKTIRTMKLDHLAMYVKDLEAAKAFFVQYFGASSNEMYHNPKTGLRTYFLSFGDGSRLEIMSRPDVVDNGINHFQTGYIHLAFSVGGKKEVDELTNTLRADGFTVVSGPRVTGDGYYESCIEGFEGNLIEIIE